MPIERERRLSLLDAARLYFVCDGAPGGRDPTSLLEGALSGGADIVQMREKAPRGADELMALAQPFRRTTTEHGRLFMLNDRPDLVAATGADGVHVGQQDMPVAAARQLAGPNALVGLSTHSPEEIVEACAASGHARPDQLSVGPVWGTPTKPGRPATGLELVEFAAREATVPWFAIGGIGPANISAVVRAGASRVVVVRAIRDADDPEAAAALLRRSLPDAAVSRGPAEERIGGHG